MPDKCETACNAKLLFGIPIPLTALLSCICAVAKLPSRVKLKSWIFNGSLLLKGYCA